MCLKLVLGTLTLNFQSISSEFDLLKLLFEYQFEELQSVLTNKIESLINSKNVLKILDLANLNNLTDLVESCNKFLDFHADELISHPDFNNLSQVSFCRLN